jgi:DNA-binding SARP family transcriptional activator/predicted ATPase
MEYREEALVKDLLIATLGVLRVTLGGEPVRGFRSDKERALLVYLAVEANRPHRREALTGLFWPDFPESNARHTLSQALTDLRTVLDDRERATPYLDATRATVALSDACRPRVDVREFDDLINDGWIQDLDARARPKLDPDAVERIAQAVTLYQGRFLHGFSLGDAPAFEEWQLLQRERLHRQATEALTLLVAHHRAEGDYETALRAAWRLVELDPWRESAQRRLIRLLALTGQRSLALRQYEICRQTLEDELGVEPDPATQALYRAVRTGTLAADVPVAQDEPPRAGGADPGDVPAPLMPLIGRDAEMAVLSEHVCDPDVRLLTLVGPGGIGKTRLALELVTVHASHYPDGAYLVPLVATRSWEACVAAIAQAVGLVVSEQSGSVEQQLLRYLGGKSMLLLLDNIEQLVAHAPRFVEIVESAPGLQIVATSRARLGVLGETVFAVNALAVPEEAALDLQALSQVAAVRLLVASAQRVAHDFRLSKDNAQDVAHICRQVEGMPLALLLAAAWADVLSPAQIFERLTDGGAPNGDLPVDFLRATWPDMPARQRSMRAVFDHSWRLMHIREQAVLQALSVFRGGFTANAAFFVVGATLREIRRLVTQSLLGRVPGGRLGMHELLRQYAAERLAKTEAAARLARDRHASYYVNMLHRWFEAAKGPRQVAALAEMDAEIDNARAAWDWIVAQEDVPQILRAVDGLCLYELRRVRFAEGASACRTALARLDERRMDDEAMEITRLRVSIRLRIWMSDFVSDAAAEDAVNRALDDLASPTLSSVDVRVERGRTLCRQADLFLNTDRHRARTLYEESLDLLRETGDRWEQARVLDRLATLTLRLTDFEATQRNSEALLRIGEALGDLHAMAYALHGLSNNALYLGRLDEATRLGRESLEVRRELSDPLVVVEGLQTLALRYVAAGRVEQALPLYDESVTIMDRLGLPAPYARGVKAWGLMLDGRYDRADNLARRALDEAQRTGERRLIAWSEHVLGSLALVDGSVDDALDRLAHCVEEFRALSEVSFLGMMLSFLGYAHRTNGDRDQARACFVEALRMGTESGASPVMASALPGIAMLYADAGRAQRAQALVAVVEQCCVMVVDSQWFADVAGAEYHAAMDTLSPDQVAEAERAVLLSDMYTEARTVLAELGAAAATT